MKYSSLTQCGIVRIQRWQRIGGSILKAVLLAFVLLAIEKPASAQDSVPTPSPSATATPTAEERRLQDENRLLELKKNNAELKKDIRESQPKPSATPLEGKTTADENVVIETQMVTYKAMSDIADRIGDEIHQKFGGAKAIAIYDPEELENLKHYRATSPILAGRIKDLKDQYADVRDALASLQRRNTWAASSNQAQIQATAGQAALHLDLGVLGNSVSSIAATGTSTSANISGSVSLATEGLKGFADLLALMRTDTEIKGKSVSVEESAMVAETFRSLRNQFRGNINLYYPKVISPEIYLEGCQKNSALRFCSETLRSLADLYAEKKKADEDLLTNMFDVTVEFEKATRQKAQAEEAISSLGKQIADLKLDRLKAELDKPWTPAQTARFEKYIKELETMKAEAVSSKTTAQSQLDFFAKRKNVLEQLQGLNQQANQLVADLVKADEKTGKSELANFMRAENMEKALGSGGYWLEFKSISAGGNNRTRKNLFRYFSGAKLDHSGGLIVEWALYDQNGVSVDSNKDSSYGGYVAPKEIQSARFKDAVADPTPESAAQTRVLARSRNH